MTTEQYVFHYDGSFDGFLTCIFDIYATKSDVFDISKNSQIALDFLTELVETQTDQVKAQRVADGIFKKIGKTGFLGIYKAFASSDQKKEMTIFGYLKLVFKFGKKVTQMLSNHCVIEFNEMLNRVNFEMHRFRGFVRFRETTTGVFVAPIRPDHDILEFLMPEFADRFGVQQFAIVDVGRNKVGIFDGEEWQVGEFSTIPNFELSDDEKLFQKLWKNYYDTVTIKQRQSERRRKQFMPKRYWEFMTEISNDRY